MTLFPVTCYYWMDNVFCHHTGPEKTPKIPEIAGKNTSIPAMIVYLPENLAGRNYWL